MAVGVLVKGPVLPVLAVLTAALSLWHRDFGWLAGSRPIYGIGLVIVICLPWAIMVSVATGGAFLDLAFKGDFLAKVKSGQESHGVFPGAFFAVAGPYLAGNAVIGYGGIGYAGIASTANHPVFVGVADTFLGDAGTGANKIAALYLAGPAGLVPDFGWPGDCTGSPILTAMARLAGASFALSWGCGGFWLCLCRLLGGDGIWWR